MSVQFNEEKASNYNSNIGSKKESKIYSTIIKLGLAKSRKSAKKVALVLAVIFIGITLWINFSEDIVNSTDTRDVTNLNTEEGVRSRINDVQMDNSLNEEQKESRLRILNRRLENID